MAPFNELKVLNQISIAAQIIDGSIEIDSVEEFETILKIFPNDPALLRIYADLLLKNQLAGAAARQYAKSAELFLDSGMLLQALVAKKLQWKIDPPSEVGEIRHFFFHLKKCRLNKIPFNTFYVGLSYAAMASIFFRLKLVSIQPGTMVKKVGDPETALSFIVVGTLRETTFVPVAVNKETLFRKSTSNLAENECFGDVVPLKEKKISRSFVESRTRVELAQLSLPDVIKICGKYREVRSGIIDLKRQCGMTDDAKQQLSDRRVARHPLPIPLSLEIDLSGTDAHPIVVEGYSRDVSIGGICVVLDPGLSDTRSFASTVKNAKVQIRLPSEAMTLSVNGTAVWSREVLFKKERTVALGIEFNEMTPKLRGLLFAYADSACKPKTAQLPQASAKAASRSGP